METTLAVIALFSLALALGGMAFFAAVVAPLVFTRLPFEHAGRFIRAMFPHYYLWVLATSAAAAVALFPLAKEAAGIMAASAGLTLWLRQVLMRRINHASDLAQAGDAAAKREFDRMHRLSVGANLVQMVAIGAVLAMFAVGA
jgi:hypothetical protein